MSDEKRLDRIEEKLDGEIQASATFRGELRQFMVSSSQYTSSVSAKADAIRESLEEHKTDKDSHGAGVKRELDGRAMGWVTVAATLIAGFAGAIGAAVHKAMGNHP